MDTVAKIQFKTKKTRISQFGEEVVDFADRLYYSESPSGYGTTKSYRQMWIEDHCKIIDKTHTHKFIAALFNFEQLKVKDHTFSADYKVCSTAGKVSDKRRYFFEVKVSGNFMKIFNVTVKMEK